MFVIGVFWGFLELGLVVLVLCYWFWLVFCVVLVVGLVGWLFCLVGGVVYVLVWFVFGDCWDCVVIGLVRLELYWWMWCIVVFV